LGAAFLAPFLPAFLATFFPTFLVAAFLPIFLDPAFFATLGTWGAADFFATRAIKLHG